MKEPLTKPQKEGPFTTRQLARILKRNVRFVIDWTEHGLFIADIKAASGHGSRREFSYPAVLRATLAVILHDKYRFNRAQVKNMLDKLWKEGVFANWASSGQSKSKGERESLSYQPNKEDHWSLIIESTGGEPSASMHPAPLEDLKKIKEVDLIFTRDLAEFEIIGLKLMPLKEAVDLELLEM